MAEVRINAEPRTEFGKGAARRTRRAGQIPAVLYGRGSEPVHLSLQALEFARALRENGRNAVLTLALEGGPQLALPKTVVTHPIRNYIEHVDLLVI
ncbi:MAG TPA: 50S ribosomal protein L25, partial [Pseudonocardia sp.]|nr:50S ribosomal protein L25 [Pseudonocardia sp.]